MKLEEEWPDGLLKSKPEIAQPKPARPLDWPDLATKIAPLRQWVINGWIGYGHTTLLVGQGGIGKTLIAQQIGSALSLGTLFIDEILRPHRVLMWACEDDHDELWRRQECIAQSFDAGLDAFAENFTLVPRYGLDNSIITTEFGKPMFTPLVATLEQQANDLGADVVILDNVAQLYGAGENDRHAVTKFINALGGALPGKAIVLLAHPARSSGSEFSGSSAWENVARTRLYLGRDLPDKPATPDDADEPDDNVRYLSRRKANYSNRDFRRFTYANGVLVPDGVEAAGATGGIVNVLISQRAERVVLEALTKLRGMGIESSEGSRSPQYLPRLILQYKFHDGQKKHDLEAAMRRLMVDGKIRKEKVDQYSNRTPKFGLTC